MAFKFALAAIIPMVFCGSVIVSYTILYNFPDMTFEAQAVLMGSICVVVNALLTLTICCHVKRNSNRYLQAGKGSDTSIYLEFTPMKSYCEFLTQNKQESTLLMESLVMEQFIDQIQPMENRV